MRIATWNVNSIKIREDRLARWLEARAPDIVCLQELKTAGDDFPYQRLQSLGYHAVASCQKAYNGVAILSRIEAQDVHCGFDDGIEDAQARIVSAEVAGVRVVSVYVPNGQVVGSDKYEYKLDWLHRLRAWLTRHHRPDQPLVVCGDLNIAPDERDVARPADWLGSVLYNPELTRLFGELQAWGLEDAFRRLHPEPGLYSWWDYRMLAFPKNDGLRIDHVLATRALAQRAREAFVDRNERKGEKPSDHAPVIVDFDWP